jgi:hypothetical protein
MLRQHQLCRQASPRREFHGSPAGRGGRDYGSSPLLTAPSTGARNAFISMIFSTTAPPLPLDQRRPRQGTQTCTCCRAAAAGERERRRVLDLVAVLEQPDALPPDLALRLGADLLAWTVQVRDVFLCEQVGEIST